MADQRESKISVNEVPIIEFEEGQEIVTDEQLVINFPEAFEIQNHLIKFNQVLDEFTQKAEEFFRLLELDETNPLYIKLTSTITEMTLNMPMEAHGYHIERQNEPDVVTVSLKFPQMIIEDVSHYIFDIEKLLERLMMVLNVYRRINEIEQGLAPIRAELSEIRTSLQKKRAEFSITQDPALKELIAAEKNRMIKKGKAFDKPANQVKALRALAEMIETMEEIPEQDDHYFETLFPGVRKIIHDQVKGYRLEINLLEALRESKKVLSFEIARPDDEIPSIMPDSVMSHPPGELEMPRIPSLPPPPESGPVLVSEDEKEIPFDVDDKTEPSDLEYIKFDKPIQVQRSKTKRNIMMAAGGLIIGTCTALGVYTGLQIVAGRAPEQEATPTPNETTFKKAPEPQVIDLEKPLNRLNPTVLKEGVNREIVLSLNPQWTAKAKLVTGKDLKFQFDNKGALSDQLRLVEPGVCNARTGSEAKVLVFDETMPIHSQPIPKIDLHCRRQIERMKAGNFRAVPNAKGHYNYLKLEGKLAPAIKFQGARNMIEDYLRRMQTKGDLSADVSLTPFGFATSYQGLEEATIKTLGAAALTLRRPRAGEMNFYISSDLKHCLNIIYRNSEASLIYQDDLQDLTKPEAKTRSGIAISTSEICQGQKKFGITVTLNDQPNTRVFYPIDLPKQFADKIKCTP